MNEIAPAISGTPAEGLLAAIFESCEDAIVSKRLDGTITSWNPAAERLFGYRAGDILGQSIRLLIPDDRQHEEDDIIARIVKGERVLPFHTVRRCKDGTDIDVTVTVSPVRDADGRIVGASKIARELGDLDLARRALAESETAIAWLSGVKYATLGAIFIPSCAPATSQSASTLKLRLS